MGSEPPRNSGRFNSPHGGSWLGLLAERGLSLVGRHPAEVVLDCFGLMHAADQATALAERAERVARGGVHLLQYHSLATILGRGQWNSLRHGHYAYYSTTALTGMLAAVTFSPRYGGTVLIAATRDADFRTRAGQRRGNPACRGQDAGGRRRRGGSRSAAQRGLVRGGCAQLLAHAARGGLTVLGYGAASRGVALLCRAGVDSGLLPGVADASPVKQRRRMPGTDFPVIGPQELVAARPDAVLLFLHDLLSEVRASLSEVEAGGGRWVDVEALPLGVGPDSSDPAAA